MMSRAGIHSKKVKILIDTDIGSEIDDALALAYLLSNPSCEVLGITTVTPESELRAMLASAVCWAAGQPGIAVHAGCEKSLAGNSFPQLCSQAPALNSLDHQTIFPTRDAVTFLREAIYKHSGEAVLLALGPLTHIAQVFQADAQIPRHLRRLVTMCGNFSSGSNVNVSKTEWNAALDPEAAERVFRTYVPGGHYVVGLETTVGFHMPTRILRRLPKSTVLQVVLKLHQTRHNLEKSLTMYDLVAAVLALDPEVAKKERGNVASSPGLGSGVYSWQRDHEAGRHFRFTAISLRKIMREFLATFSDEVYACKSE